MVLSCFQLVIGFVYQHKLCEFAISICWYVKYAWNVYKTHTKCIECERAVARVRAGVSVARGRGRGACVYGRLHGARTRAYARIRVDVCTRSAAYACKRKRAVTKTARMVYVLTSRTYSLLLILLFALFLTCKRNSCYHAYTHTQ